MSDRDALGLDEAVPAIERTDDVEDEEEEAADDTGCTRCDAPLIFLGEKKFHEGDSGVGFLFGPLRELFENRQRIEMWACHDCGHVEFFMPLRQKRRAGKETVD